MITFLKTTKESTNELRSVVLPAAEELQSWPCPDSLTGFWQQLQELEAREEMQTSWLKCLLISNSAGVPGPSWRGYGWQRYMQIRWEQWYCQKGAPYLRQPEKKLSFRKTSSETRLACNTIPATHFILPVMWASQQLPQNYPINRLEDIKNFYFCFLWHLPFVAAIY